MKKVISFILLNVAIILLFIGILGQFIFKGNDYDLCYTITLSAGVSILLLYIFSLTGNWGVIPAAVLFLIVSIYWMIDITVVDDFVKTDRCEDFIIIISIICYILILFTQLWRK